MTGEAESELLTVAQVANQKGVSREAVRRAIRQGRLASSRLGKMWTITREAAAEWQPRSYIDREGEKPRGGRPHGYHHTEETKKKMSESQRRRNAAPGVAVPVADVAEDS